MARNHNIGFDVLTKEQLVLILTKVFILREKVLAKLKLSAQSDFEAGVETDEQLWGLIKKFVLQIFDE